MLGVLVRGDVIHLPADNVHFEPAIYNFYGPSENTVCATVKRFEAGKALKEQEYSIGRPLRNVEIKILSTDGVVCPPGTVGEIAIAGSNLAIGYVNQPELTANKFISNSKRWPQRHYLTGDMGYINAEGELIFLGREDKQVQIRGFRVELFEIEEVLTNNPHVQSASVHYAKETEQLKAFVTPTLSDQQLQQVRESLVALLPHYMIPQLWFSMASFPLTPNDKIDSGKLALMSSNDISEKKSELAHLSALEQKVASIFAQVLNVPLDTLHPESSFFELGGHSLLAMQLQNAFRKQGLEQASIGMLLSNPTIGGFSAVLFQESVAPNKADVDDSASNFNSNSSPDSFSNSPWEVFSNFEHLCEKHKVTKAQLAVGKAGQVLLGQFGLVADGGALNNEGSGQTTSLVAPEQFMFRISCNSKLLTLIVGLKLAEQNLIDLDQDVVEFVPQLAKFTVWQGVTLRHLLSHRHGLDFPLSTQQIEIQDQLLDVIHKGAFEAKRYAQPGTMHGYTMIGHAVAAYVFEQVTDTPFAQLLEQVLIRPLGIRLAMTGAPTGSEFVTEGHIVREGELKPAPIPAHKQALSASGSLGCYMSSQDLLKVCFALIPKRKGGCGLLLDSSIAQVYENDIAVENHPVISRAGMSFFKLTNGYWGHLGDGEGQHSYIQIDIESGMALVCQTTLYPSAGLFWELAGTLFPIQSETNINALSGNVKTEVEQSTNHAGFDITGCYQNSLVHAETQKIAGQTILVVSLAFESETNLPKTTKTTFKLKAVDEDGFIFQVVNPDKVVKGSITYFSNPQGSFMRIGQTLLKKYE